MYVILTELIAVFIGIMVLFIILWLRFARFEYETARVDPERRKILSRIEIGMFINAAIATILCIIKIFL